MESISITINNLSKEAAAELLLKFCSDDTNKKQAKNKPAVKEEESPSSEGDLAEFDASLGSVSNEQLLEAATKFISKSSDPKEARALIKKQLKKFGVESMTSVEAENREEMMQFLSKPIKK